MGLERRREGCRERERKTERERGVYTIIRETARESRMRESRLAAWFQNASRDAPIFPSLPRAPPLPPSLPLMGAFSPPPPSSQSVEWLQNVCRNTTVVAVKTADNNGAFPCPKNAEPPVVVESLNSYFVEET